MPFTFIQHLLDQNISEGYAENNQANQRLLNSILNTLGHPKLGQKDGDKWFIDYLSHTYEDILTAEHIVNALEELVAAREDPSSVYNAEEEEPKMPARRDREMVSQGIRNRTPNERGGIRSNKRNAQAAGRHQRSMHGKGSGGGNYMDNLFGKGGRPEDY